MSWSNRITEALKKIPTDIAIKVGLDIDKRITDWLAAGGKDDDPYIEQQVRFAENVAKRCEEGAEE